MNKILFEICVAGLLLMGLGACATTTTSSSGSPSIKVPERPITVPESTDAPSNTITADETLREKAITEIEAENYSQAARLLDRALRIDPRNAETYYQYARLRDAEQRHNEALQFIQKGLSLTGRSSTQNKLLQLKATIERNH